jgi:hypothetical protein
MPRTRSQAVESPLVSLDTPRRKRKATATTTKPSTATNEETTAKPKRGRKLSKKEAVPENASEEIARTKSEIIDTQGTEVTHTQEPQTQTEEPKTPEPQEEAPIVEAAKDNDSIIPPTTPKREIDTDMSSISSRGSIRSLCSPAKKRSVQKALATVKEALKKPRQLIKQRLNRLRNSSEPSSGAQTTETTTTAPQSSPSTDYSLAEDEILDAALEIILHRMEGDSFATNPFVSSSLRCPCCQDALKFECPRNHDLQSWIPDEAKEKLNAVLTTMFAEGIATTLDEKENARRTETNHKTEQSRKAAPQKKKAELSSKKQGKKRARESHEDDDHDEAPSAQRPRLTSSAGRTPYNNNNNNKRRTTTTTPRRRLPYAEIRRRALEREQGNSPSIFRLDQIVAQHDAQEKAQKAAEEAAEEERLLAISRAAMERHAVIGPVPENMRDSFEVPVFDDGHQDSDMSQAPEIQEAPEFHETHQAHETNEAHEAQVAHEAAPETPSPSTWGFDLRNFFNSVSGSVRRFVPSFRNDTTQAVPFGK